MFRVRLSLAVICGLTAISCGPLAFVAAQEGQSPPAYAAVLKVRKMCCAKESKPAIKELSKLEGVKQVDVDHKTHTLFIQATEVTPSAREIWDVAERLKIVPLQLETAAGVYTTRPRR